ncbi:YjdF family protein [Miniphocaeibacter massiliensis]|uniref:YjdF family protein n=1 Tax=Miniphocaeibacter massiliensis TaxID=2041841 RepID=UPI001A922CD3
MMNSKLTVYFENPFWVGVFERREEGKLSVAKVTFGSEPKDYEVYEFILKYYDNLQFSSSIEDVVTEKKKNPKRMQRYVKKQLKDTGVGTKSQQALQLQHEQNKKIRKKKSKEEKLAESKRIFELKQQKKKEKHKGR